MSRTKVTDATEALKAALPQRKVTHEDAIRVRDGLAAHLGLTPEEFEKHCDTAFARDLRAKFGGGE